MRNLYLISFLFIGYQSLIFAQVDDENNGTLDTQYREDQFYFGVTYDLLGKMPDGMAQNGFSGGFHFGFIRDMPINKNRNVALGLGLGYSTNSINQNLLITEDLEGNLNYEIVESGSFTKNKFTVHLIEVPFEFRWRSSKPDIYKFFRLYPGFKIGYVIASSVKFKGELNNYKLKNIDDFSDIQYGFTISAGYDKFNAHIYYVLNSIFKDQTKLNSQTLDTSMIKIGLMLYIL